MPYVEVHGNENARDAANVVDKILDDYSGKVPAAVMELLKQTHQQYKLAHERNLEESQQILRYFREKGPKRKAGGGGGGGNTPPAQETTVTAYPLCNFIFEAEKLEVPSHVVMWSMWNRHNARVFKPVRNNVNLLDIRGTVWVEGHDTRTPTQHVINAKLDIGSPQINGDTLLGFDVGFKRYDSDRTKFFIDVHEYPVEPYNTPNSKIKDEISTSSRKFVSVLPVLTDALLEEYSSDGLRFKCDLTIFAENR